MPQVDHCRLESRQAVLVLCVFACRQRAAEPGSGKSACLVAAKPALLEVLGGEIEMKFELLLEFVVSRASEQTSSA
jgi:hypothetical protein